MFSFGSGFPGLHWRRPPAGGLTHGPVMIVGESARADLCNAEGLQASALRPDPERKMWPIRHLHYRT